MSLVRMLVTSKVTVSHTFKVDTVPTDAAGAVTVAVKRLDGTDAGSGTATHTTTGTYTFDVTRAVLDKLTIDWTGSVGGSTVTVRDYVEVVGGFFFGLDEAYDELGLSQTTWPQPKLARKRIQVEQECEERICRRAFVPRFEREVLSGNNTERLGLKWPDIRAVRAVTVGGVAWSGADVTALGFSDSGVLTRPGGALWPAGLRNVVVEYEYGLDEPPIEVHDGGMLRLRSILPRMKSGVPDRTTSFTDPLGSTYRLSLPTGGSPDGKQLPTTGIPEVDGAYHKWARRRRAVVA